MTLELLAERALDGDRQALTDLLEALEAPVFRLSLRILGTVSEAEDATQDILIRVMTHLSQFEGRSALLTWVHQVAVRHLLAAKKSRAETRALDAPELSELLKMGLALAVTLPAPTPEQLLLSREVRLACTQGMLLMLGREDRLALVLVEVLDFSAVEAARICAVEHAAFRQRLHRAREKLVGFLRRECGLVSPSAACHCSKQVAPKCATGGLKTAPLTALANAGGTDDAAAHRALAELKAARSACAVFHVDGALAAPATLHTRLLAAMPTVLRG